MRQRSSLVPYIFLLPALIVMGLTIFIPASFAFLLSFTRYQLDLTMLPEWVGLANFQRILKDQLFWQTIKNSLLYIMGVVPILVFAPLALAILVNQKLKGISWFRMSFYTPVVISLVVAGIAWKAIYASNGLLNVSLKAFGIPSIPWLTSPNLAIWSVMIVTIWKGLGYYMVIYLAGLQSISPDLYEAAALDGCQGWHKHWAITLPLMRPYLLLVAVISAISATKVFEEIYIITGGGPRNSSKTIVYYIYEKAFQELDLSYACAIGFLLFLGILALSIINLRLSVKTQR